MTDQRTPDTESSKPVWPAATSRRPSPTVTGIAAATLVAVGLVAGAGVMVLAAPSERMMLLQPVAVASLAPDSLIAVRGKVSEIYGNKFVLDDGTGRTLVDTGRRGEGGTLVAPGEALTVQGRFENGFIHGELLVRADGHAETLKPPRPGPKGWLDRIEGPGVTVAQPTKP